jgi:hypothetical protein
MKIKLLVLAVAICMIVTPAKADLAVVLSSDSINLTVQSNTTSAGINTVTAQVAAAGTGSDMRVNLQDSITFANLDGVEITPYNLAFDITFVGSGNAYTASGTFKLWDASSSVNPDIYASFTGTSINYTASTTGPGQLQIDGLLRTPSGFSSILQPTSTPWVFQGTSQDGTNNADGNATTVTVPLGVHNYDAGSLVSLYFPIINTADMQTLFSTTSNIGNGDLQAVIVPVPAALVLGVLGLSVAGLKLRKFA